MKTMTLIVLLALAVVAATPKPAPLDDAALFGPTIDISERRGLLDFGSGVTEELNRNNLVSYGIVVGKRFIISRKLRVQLSGNFKYGSTPDDTIPTDSSQQMEATQIKRSLLQAGIIADLQIPLYLDLQGPMQPHFYVRAGGGLHLAAIAESEAILGAPTQMVTGDPYLEPNHTTISVSIHGGLGYEFLTSPNFGMAFEGLIRYWYPVRYTMTRDIFPMGGVPYSERFISFEFNLLFLVKL